MKYPRLKHNEWVNPRMKRYQLMCCDCGLVHDIDLKVEHIGPSKRHSIKFRARRNNRSTAQSRRHKNSLKGLTPEQIMDKAFNFVVLDKWVESGEAGKKENEE